MADQPLKRRAPRGVRCAPWRRCEIRSSSARRSSNAHQTSRLSRPRRGQRLDERRDCLRRSRPRRHSASAARTSSAISPIRQCSIAVISARSCSVRRSAGLRKKSTRTVDKRSRAAPRAGACTASAAERHRSAILPPSSRAAVIRFRLTSGQLWLDPSHMLQIKEATRRHKPNSATRYARPRPRRGQTESRARIALRREKQPRLARHAWPAFSIRAASANATAAIAVTMIAPQPATVASSPRQPSAARRCRRPATSNRRLSAAIGSGFRRSVARRLAMMSSGVDSDQQHRARRQASRGVKHAGRDKRQRRAPPRSARRPDAGFHQMLGREFLDRRQARNGSPNRAAARAIRPTEVRSKSSSCSARSTSNGSRAIAPTGNAHGAILQRPPKQGRLQIPVAKDRRGRSEESAHRPGPRRPSAIPRRSVRTSA